MAIIDQYIQAMTQKLTKQAQLQRQTGLNQLASRGVIGSQGAEFNMEKQIQEGFNQRLSEVLPEAMLQDRNFQQQVSQFQEQMQQQRANQAMVASQNQQQMADRRREFDINVQNQLYDREQKERLQQEMLNAQKTANENWWQPVLGQVVGTVAGAYATKSFAGAAAGGEAGRQLGYKYSGQEGANDAKNALDQYQNTGRDIGAMPELTNYAVNSMYNQPVFSESRVAPTNPSNYISNPRATQGDLEYLYPPTSQKDLDYLYPNQYWKSVGKDLYRNRETYGRGY